MLGLSLPDNDEEGMPSPMSNDPKTALDARDKSEGHGADKESEGPGAEKESEGPRAEKDSGEEKPFISSGIGLAPVDNLLSVVNGNLKDCEFCKGHPLVLELDCRVGLAANWKLSCSSCLKKDKSLENRIRYLKSTIDDSKDYKERRWFKKTINRKEHELKKKRDALSYRYISSPIVMCTAGKQKK